MKIVIKGSTLVCPFEQTPSRRLWLSTTDVMYTDRGYVPLLFFYKFDGSPNFFDPLVLKESLSKVLVPFYPVAGRLTRDGNSRIEIDCNGKGVLYAEAVSDSPMSDIGGFNSGLELVKVFPPINRSLHDLYSSPLFAVQVTRFSCGGVSLGIGCHHNLSDGTGFLNLITSWSELARGLSTSMPPLLDRDILRARVPPTPVFYHHEFDKPPVMITSFTQNSEESSSSKADSSIVLEITSDHMKTLVSMIGDERTKIKYTRYEILSAFLWRVACKARNLPDTQATKMRIPINGRPRLNPPIPPNYFGNALFICTTTALCGELVSEPFAHSVDRIHEAIRRMDDKYLRSALDFLDKTDELTTIMQGPQNTACPNFSIVSWNSFPFHGVNFGWGQPYMRPASIFAGKGYVLASPTDKEGLMLAICLEAEHIQAFLEIFHASFQVLKESISKVLVPSYPVAGRLSVDGNGRIEIDCNGQGVWYAEAVADSAMSDIGYFSGSKELVKVIPPINRSLHGLYSSPSLAAQLLVQVFETQNLKQSSGSESNSSVILEITSDYIKTLTTMTGNERGKTKGVFGLRVWE